MEGLNQWNDMMLFIARKKKQGREKKREGRRERGRKDRP